MRPMHDVALEHVAEGRTTLVEVERVLGQVLEWQPEQEEVGPPRALIVDDDADARLLLRSLMEQEGFEVDEATDGLAALDILGADPDYRLVLLDLRLGGIGGLELLHAGADDFVTKETDPSRLMARVRAVMRRAV